MVKRLVMLMCALMACLVLPARSAEAAEPQYFLPFPDGVLYSVTQGPGGATSHFNTSNRYAYDFNMGSGSLVTASAPGVVRKSATTATAMETRL